jgi:serine/threonine-protein kinase RsbW
MSSPRGLSRVENMIRAMKTIWNLGEDTYRRISTAVSEAVKNAIRHGNKNDESKTVKIEMRNSGDHYEFTIEDEGTGISQRAVEGEGMKTMKRLASRLKFQKNRVKLEF